MAKTPATKAPAADAPEQASEAVLATASSSPDLPETSSTKAAPQAVSASPVPPAVAELAALLGLDPKELTPEAVLALLKRGAAETKASAPAPILPEPDRNELVAIFNKNPPGGDFVHHVYEDVKAEDGRVVGKKPKAEFRAVARGFSHVPRWVAALWMKQAPGTIVDAAGVGQRSSAPVQSERVAAVEAENSELKTRLLNMEKMISELQRTKA